MHFAYLPVHILAGEYGLRLVHCVLALGAAIVVGVGGPLGDCAGRERTLKGSRQTANR